MEKRYMKVNTKYGEKIYDLSTVTAEQLTAMSKADSKFEVIEYFTEKEED